MPQKFCYQYLDQKKILSYVVKSKSIFLHNYAKINNNSKHERLCIVSRNKDV